MFLFIVVHEEFVDFVVVDDVHHAAYAAVRHHGYAVVFVA